MPTNIKYSLSLTACVLTLALGAISTPAMANTIEAVVYQDAQEYKIVKADETLLRCGDQDVFYAIAELNAKMPLEVLGTSGSYTKVRMPAAIGAFVPSNEVDVSADGQTVTLIASSKLRAPSHLLGLSGSWKALYADGLKAGTELAVLEALKSDAGDVVGYRVSPPQGPSGEIAIAYIRTDALRDPNAGEVANYNPSNTEIETETVETIPESEPATQDAEEIIEEPVSQVDTSMMEDMNTSTAQPVEISNAAPVDVQETDLEEDAAPIKPAQRTAPSGLLTASALEDLESAFKNARSLSKAELDQSLDELHAEFSRTRAQADDGTSLATALDQRLEWIDIRIETRNQRQSIAAILAAYDANADQFAKDIQAWQSGRAYQLVGRMTTSAVYTGEHLPLLYRIQAIDPSTGATRTVGYVAPRSTQDFRHLLGQVVGVIGSTNNDDSLKLTIIEPDRIEPMPE